MKTQVLQPVVFNVEKASRFIVVIALKFLDRQQLSELLDFCICLRNAHAHVETKNQQHEDKKQEYEVRGRIDTGNFCQKIKYTRENAQYEQNTCKQEPNDRIFQFHF